MPPRNQTKRFVFNALPLLSSRRNVGLIERSRTKCNTVIICEECHFHWCFGCHSPSHDGLKCKENIDGTAALKGWTKKEDKGQKNARKCPRWELLMQRASGCDDMTCTQCKTSFCYKYGGRHLRRAAAKLVGATLGLIGLLPVLLPAAIVGAHRLHRHLKTHQHKDQHSVTGCTNCMSGHLSWYPMIRMMKSSHMRLVLMLLLITIPI